MGHKGCGWSLRGAGAASGGAAADNAAPPGWGRHALPSPLRDQPASARLCEYLRSKFVLPNDVADSSNLAAVQLTLELPADGATSFDLVFHTQPERDTAGQRLSALSGAQKAALLLPLRGSAGP